LGQPLHISSRAGAYEPSPWDPACRQKLAKDHLEELKARLLRQRDRFDKTKKWLTRGATP
jgi:hypothetical protein